MNDNVKDEGEKAETVKRLTPTPEVLRELFLKSGNLCAFLGCNRSIMNQEGLFVGQLCHIEAASKGGERFNENQSNEERRAASNLVLLCYDHHVVTNDVEKWTVTRMQELKANHERRIFDFIDSLQLRIVDYTVIAPLKPTLTLARLAELKKWNLAPDDNTESVMELNALLQILKEVPTPARTLLAVIISKVERYGYDRGYVSLHEIRLACALSHETLSELIQILDKYSLIRHAGEDDYGHPRICVTDLSSGWSYWEDLRVFSDAGLATLQEMIEGLNFSLLD